MTQAGAVVKKATETLVKAAQDSQDNVTEEETKINVLLCNRLQGKLLAPQCCDLSHHFCLCINPWLLHLECVYVAQAFAPSRDVTLHTLFKVRELVVIKLRLS